MNSSPPYQKAMFDFLGFFRSVSPTMRKMVPLGKKLGSFRTLWILRSSLFALTMESGGDNHSWRERIS